MTAAASLPASRSRTGAIILLVVGAVLIVAGPVLGMLTGSLAMIPGALAFADRTVEVSPSGEVAMEAGESLYLLAPVADLDRVAPGDCAASDAHGTSVPLNAAPATALNTLVDGRRYESFARLTAETSGPQRIVCGTGGIPVIVAPPFVVGTVLGPLLWWSVGGLAISVIGVVLVIVGIVRVTRRGA